MAAMENPPPRHRLILIAAVAKNRVIGRGNDLVWRDPLDMQRFKAATLGHTVVMGRKTWESLPPRFRPLPGRRNIVVSRQTNYDAPGAEVAGSLAAALEMAGSRPDLGETPPVFVVGGGELYAQALPLAEQLLITEVDLAPRGDALFPPIAPDRWREAGREDHTATDGTRFAFKTYTRIR